MYIYFTRQSPIKIFFKFLNYRVRSYTIYFIDFGIVFFKIDFIVFDFDNRKDFVIFTQLFSPKCLMININFRMSVYI